MSLRATAAMLKLLRFIILLRRIDNMYKQSMNVAKGVGLGLLTGAAVAAIGAKAMSGGSHKKAAHMKKNASRYPHGGGYAGGYGEDAQIGAAAGFHNEGPYIFTASDRARR